MKYFGLFLRTRDDMCGVVNTSLADIIVVSFNIWTFYVALTARPVIAQGVAPKAQTLGMMKEKFPFIRPALKGRPDLKRQAALSGLGKRRCVLW